MFRLLNCPLKSVVPRLGSSNFNLSKTFKAFSPLITTASSASFSSPFKPSSPFFISSKSFASFSPRLKELKNAAELYPFDTRYQLLYYNELIREDPSAVVRRFEEDKFASDAECYKVYTQARSMMNDANRDRTNNNNAGQNEHATNNNIPPSVNVNIVSDYRDPKSMFPWKTILYAILFGGFIFYMYRNPSVSGSLGGMIGSANGSGVKEYKAGLPSVPTVTFDDVKGVDEAKAELEEVVAFLRNPEQFTKLGGKMPKGILLLGPPGTGKTLLAKAVAGEAGVPFFFASGSEFEEMFVGVGARRIRDLFAAAKKKQPAIIFIDEIDSVGSKRSAKDVQAARMSLNELLVQLDGFSATTGVIVIGATNFASLLDPALVRPGRFDRHVTVSLPDVKGRKEILELYASKVTMDSAVDLNQIARGTPGMTGADLSNLVNTAALRAAQVKAESVNIQHLEWAKDRILMGAERKSHKMSEQDRKLTAYHEGGHALVALTVPGAMPIHKATILPRGQALGMVSMLPEGDQDSHTRQEMIARMTVAMGGRVAEELIFGKDAVTTGASSDLEQATNIARAMVMKYGMAEENVGHISLGSQQDLETMSPELKKAIDNEIKKLLDNAYSNATQILTKRGPDLHNLAKALLTYETLEKDEIIGVIDGKEPQKRLLNENSKNKGNKSSGSGSLGLSTFPIPLPVPVPGLPKPKQPEPVQASSSRPN